MCTRPRLSTRRAALGLDRTSMRPYNMHVQCHWSHAASAGNRRHTRHHAMRTTSIGSIAAASRHCHSCLAAGAVCHVQQPATPTAANCPRRRGVVLLSVCGGARLHAAPVRGRRRCRDAQKRAPAAASGVPPMRHAPLTISSQARRRLWKELKPPSRQHANGTSTGENVEKMSVSGWLHLGKSGKS